MHMIIVRVLALLACWRVAWLLIYLLTGFYIGYISINNGISFNKIQLDRGFKLTASSVRLRLWGNTRKLVISDLHIILPPSSPESTRKRSPRGLDSEPISLYPSSFVLRCLLKAILHLSTRIDVELKRTKVDHESIAANAKSVSFLWTSHNSANNSDAYEMAVSFSLLQAECALKHSSKSSEFLNVGTTSLSLKTSVEKRSGVLSKVVIKVYVDEIEVDVFHTFEQILVPQTGDAGRSLDSQKDSTQTDVASLESLYRKLSPCFKECSINIAYFCVRGIPLIPPTSDSTLSDYFCHGQASETLYISVDAVSLHTERLLPKSAGYDVHFNSTKDVPLHVTFSSSLIKAGVATESSASCQSPYCSAGSELLSLPNLSFTFKTNAARRLIDGLGFKNCLMEFFSSANSPILDVDHYQFAALVYNYTVWKKLLALRHFEKLHEEPKLAMAVPTSDSDDDTGDDTKIAQEETPDSFTTGSSNSSFLDRLMKLLRQFYPQIDAKLTVEQPRVLLRVVKPKEEKVQMLVFSYSLMVIHFMTTDTQDYDMECQLLHPNLSFNEKSDSSTFHEIQKEEVCGSADARLTLKIYNDLKLKTQVRFIGAFLNLTKPDVLNGIQDIMNETSHKIAYFLKTGIINLQCDGNMSKTCNQYSKLANKLKPRIENERKGRFFEPLPAWFVSFVLKIEDVQVRLGSTSPLLPPDYISKLSDADNQRFAHTESILNLSASTISLTLGDADSAGQSYASSHTSSSQTSSSAETLAGDFLSGTCWIVLSQIENFKLSFTSHVKDSVIVSVPVLNHKLTSISEASVSKLVHECDVKLLQVNLDRHKLFTVFGSAYLIDSTVISSLRKFRINTKRHSHSLQSTSEASKTSGISSLCQFNWGFEQVEMTVALSNEFKVRLQAYGLSNRIFEGSVTTKIDFLRAMVISSSLAHHWDRVLCVDSLSSKIRDTSETQSVTIVTHAIRFIQPHGFVVHKLFDSLSEFVKIAKHLAKCFHSREKETTIIPKESSPLVSPGIQLTTAKLFFIIEDDPFDSELNMIYQLGLVEQRKRLEYLSVFEEQAKSKHLSNTDCQSKLDSLHKLFEAQWIRKIQAYRQELGKEISDNKGFLYGIEGQLPVNEYERIKPYPLHAPLLSVMLTGVSLCVLQPQFTLRELPRFINQHGQGVPEDMKYSLMIPAFIDLKVEELRMHLRDYPLPLFHLPYAKDRNDMGRALMMSGHLVICESLVLDRRHLRELKVQLTDATRNPSLQPNAFDKLKLQKSLSTVKVFTDMSVSFDSESPSRFVWGHSYQFGIQQILLTVDQFSKPPVDPSVKLGFWDKLRFIIHGKICVQTGVNASIEVAFKGGKDPYDLFGESNGFVLGFKDSVVWKINDHDDSLSFFDISAEKLSWYIPNYLANPLMCWTREGSKSVYLPNYPDSVTSCYAYYLFQHSQSESTPELVWCEKKVVELSGGIQFSVGFLLQRLSQDKEEWTSDGTPHYEVELCNPRFTKEGHDSYSGFRSDRIHMAISLKAHTKHSYNSIHLSPGVFKHFFAWWTMFQGNMLLPVRKGRLFQEIKSSQKFSKHLHTNKFLFDIGHLFISHIFHQKDTEDEDDFHYCVGLRAKVKEFSVDLHQRKEEVLDVHEDLSRHQKILKMRFNLGQILLSKIDLRAIGAEFERNLYNPDLSTSARVPKHFFNTFDSDQEWFDLRDFEECFEPGAGKVKSARALPLLYSETFAYVRDTSYNRENRDSLDETMHRCILHATDYKASEIELYKRRAEDLETLGRSGNCTNIPVSARIKALRGLIDACEASKDDNIDEEHIAPSDSSHESYKNKILLVSMFLKWNGPVRNLLLKYIHFVNLSSIHRKYLSHKFMSMLEEIIGKEGLVKEESSLDTWISRLTSRKDGPAEHINERQDSQERFLNFDKIIRSVGGRDKILEDYKIEVISPQIQLHTEELEDSVVVITAPSLISKIISVIPEKEAQYQDEKNILEKRYGVILRDASVMVIDKEDVKLKNSSFELAPYGTQTKWPPFLGIETCKMQTLASRDNVLVNKMSSMFTFTRMLASNLKERDDRIDDTSSDNGADKLRIDVPSIEINCTSKQYFTLYATILSLLLYVEPMAAELREKISKLNFSNDFQDFPALHERLTNLHGYVGIIRQLLKNYSFRQNGHLDNEDLNDYLYLARKRRTLETEIVMMQETIFSGDLVTSTLSHVMQNWYIAADEVVLHMLNDDRSHIIDLSIDHGVYKRTVRDDGSNDNTIEIASVEGRTRVPGSFFDKFLEPIRASREGPLITVDWSMNRSIGGIKIIDNFDICSSPLSVKIDEKTGRSLMRFIFRQSGDVNLERSPVMKLADRAHMDNAVYEGNSDENDSDTATKQNRDRADSDTKSSTFESSSKKVKSKVSSLNTSLKMDLDQDVESMIQRSRKYLSVARLTSQSFEVMISLRMQTGAKKWLNVTNFLLVLPRWEIKRRILSLLDIVNHFKSVIIKALMSHAGSLLKNKVTSRSRNLQRYKRKFGASNLHLASPS
ncbi:hypothetical protein OXX79_000941 [Metschnikowia pulcherrima]